MIFIILGALFIIMAVSLTIGYVVQANANQTAMQYAEAHMRPHTYHITSIAKSDDTKWMSTKEGIQFIIEPDDNNLSLNQMIKNGKIIALVMSFP